MSVPEHTLYQGELGRTIEDIITFDTALNLVGATAQLIYSVPESGNKTTRSASISPTPSFEAATACSFQRDVTNLDTDVVGIFAYQWKLTLAEGEVLYFPTAAPSDQFPERQMPCFEVVLSIDGFTEVSDSETSVATTAFLIGTVTDGAYQLISITRDGDDVITSASVIWPDGSAGVFTTLLKNPTFLTIDSYSVTHVNSGKTVTQPTVTRDSDGIITTKPALTLT